MSDGGFWSDEKVTDLKRLRKDGLSHTQIAKALGAKSRCAIAGKLHRLGLSEPKQRAKEIGAEHGRVRPKKTRFPVSAVIAQTVPASALFAALEGSSPRDLLSLTEEDCRWPIDGAERTFCCLPAKQGPYCKAHARMAYQPASEPLHRYLRSLRRYAA